jgi:2,4-diaminopentanoate dehydrogenase
MHSKKTHRRFDMKKTRVIVWGLGAMGGGVARLVLEKPGLVLVGAIDSHPEKYGKTLSEVLGVPAPDVKVAASHEAVVVNGAADVVVVATGSFTREVFPQLKAVAQAKMDCITLAEEMAYPAAAEPALAREIDSLFADNGVSVLGTGINPGFILDSLILALTSVCADVTSIRAVRVNDLSPFGPTVMRTQGVGTTPEQFDSGIKDGSIVGHVGFPESMSLIASALGVNLTRIEQTKEPILSQTERQTPHVTVKPGMVAGCKHIAYGYVGDKLFITLEHPQQVHPGLENVDTGDYIYISGTPEISMAIKPEIPGGIGTIAIAVNMIPSLVAAAPGLRTMADLPVPRALLGEIAGAGVK